MFRELCGRPPIHIFGTTLLLSRLAWSIFNCTQTKQFSTVCVVASSTINQLL